MRLHRLEREQVVERPLCDVFECFAQTENLERITPSWLHFRLLTPVPIEMGPGTLIDYRLRLHGLPLRWTSRIEVWEKERCFVDEQVRGPCRSWRHLHEFAPVGAGTRVRDRELSTRCPSAGGVTYSVGRSSAGTWSGSPTSAALR